jgi:hypothetical protein
LARQTEEILATLVLAAEADDLDIDAPASADSIHSGRTRIWPASSTVARVGPLVARRPPVARWLSTGNDRAVRMGVWKAL